MAEERPTFEIIHDEAPEPKRKRKPFIPYLYLPWRWMAVAFASGAVGNDAYRVQLNAGANILRYITGDFNNLVEWDLGTGETRTMCLC